MKWSVSRLSTQEVIRKVHNGRCEALLIKAKTYLSLSKMERKDPQTSQTRNFLSVLPALCFFNSLMRLYQHSIVAVNETNHTVDHDKNNPTMTPDFSFVRSSKRPRMISCSIKNKSTHTRMSHHPSNPQGERSMTHLHPVNIVCFHGMFRFLNQFSHFSIDSNNIRIDIRVSTFINLIIFYTLSCFLLDTNSSHMLSV